MQKKEPRSIQKIDGLRKYLGSGERAFKSLLIRSRTSALKLSTQSIGLKKEN